VSIADRDRLYCAITLMARRPSSATGQLDAGGGDRRAKDTSQLEIVLNTIYNVGEAPGCSR